MTPHFSVPGIVEKVGAQTLTVRVKRSLPEHVAVSIEFGAETRKGQIVRCQPADDWYEVSVSIADRNECDLRSAERFPLTRDVRIQASGRNEAASGIVVDVSIGGMGLEVRAPLKRGEILSVESDSDIAFGVIRYCRRLRDDLYRAGFEVFHVMPKDR